MPPKLAQAFREKDARLDQREREQARFNQQSQERLLQTLIASSDNLEPGDIPEQASDITIRDTVEKLRKNQQVGQEVANIRNTLKRAPNELNRIGGDFDEEFALLGSRIEALPEHLRKPLLEEFNNAPLRARSARAVETRKTAEVVGLAKERSKILDERQTKQKLLTDRLLRQRAKERAETSKDKGAERKAQSANFRVAGMLGKLNTTRIPDPETGKAGPPIGTVFPIEDSGFAIDRAAEINRVAAEGGADALIFPVPRIETVAAENRFDLGTGLRDTPERQEQMLELQFLSPIQAKIAMADLKDVSAGLANTFWESLTESQQVSILNAGLPEREEDLQALREQNELQRQLGAVDAAGEIE